MSEDTLKNYKQDKLTLQNEILALIQNFETEYDCHVEQVSLFEIQTAGFQTPKTITAKIRVNLG